MEPDRAIDDAAAIGIGVNLDEEAANLIVYQQYYQACAKVVEVGTSLLDTILDIS
ncbi:flagellar basal body rod C-terminal domain-containing protein [Pseudomonas sp. NA13]